MEDRVSMGKGGRTFLLNRFFTFGELLSISKIMCCYSGCWKDVEDTVCKQMSVCLVYIEIPVVILWDTWRKRSKSGGFNCWLPQMGKQLCFWTALQMTPSSAGGSIALIQWGRKNRFGSMWSAGHLFSILLPNLTVKEQVQLQSLSRGSVRIVMRVRVTWLGSPPRPAELLAQSEENLGWVIGNGRCCILACSPEINCNHGDYTSPH